MYFQNEDSIKDNSSGMFQNLEIGNITPLNEGEFGVIVSE
jgi:hypothetical protein